MATTTTRMFLAIVICLSILMVDGHILGSRLARRQAQKCANGASANDPCSIPIQHVLPSTGEDEYRNSAEGDNFLDMYGLEATQAPNVPPDQRPKGTPTRKMTPSAALNLAKSSFLWDKRQNSTFWVVELVMDCSKTGGMFQVQAVTESISPEDDDIREMRDRELDPRRFSGFTSRFNPTMNLNNDENGRFFIPGLESWFTDDIKSSLQSISRSLRKHPVAEARSVTVKTSTLNRRAASGGRNHGNRDEAGWYRRRSRKRMEQLPCSGDIRFRAPSVASGMTHIGLCGYANIFTYNSNNVLRQTKGICEINALS